MSLELALKGLISEVLKEAGVVGSLSNVDAANPTATTATTPPKRGRGRPAQGEAPAAPAAPTPDTQSTPPQTDPFVAASPAKPPAPVATVEEARTALIALAGATTQANAVAVMKGVTGSETLSPGLMAEQYGALVVAANAAVPAAKPTAPVDPFAATAAAPAATAKPLMIEDVRNVIVETQKRTSADTCKKVVMDHGGKAPKPDGGGDEASLKALPEANYAATIAALKALPSTK